MASAAPKPKPASNKTRSSRRSGKAWKKGSPEVLGPKATFTLEGVQRSGRGKASGHSRKGMKVGHKVMAPYIPQGLQEAFAEVMS